MRGPQVRTGEVTVVLSFASVTAYYENGVLVSVASDDPKVTFNLEAIRRGLKNGWSLKDALISARDTRPNRLASQIAFSNE